MNKVKANQSEEKLYTLQLGSGRARQKFNTPTLMLVEHSVA